MRLPLSIVRTGVFLWTSIPITIGIGLLFAWELGGLAPLLVPPPRPPATTTELLFAIAITILSGLNAGLAAWTMRYGACPRGVRRATGIGSLLAAIGLLCPTCIALPLTAIGVTFSLGILTPFLPLLRLVALLVLGSTLVLLLQRLNAQTSGDRR